MGAGRGVAVALFRHGVHDHGAGIVLGGGQGVFHGLEVVAVDGTDVLHAEVLEHALRGPPVLDALLHGVQALVGELPRGAALLQFALPPLERAFIGGGGPEGIDRGAQGREVVGEPADRRGVGAAVVVDHNHDTALLVRRDVVDGLPGHAAGQGAVAHHRDDEAVAVAGQLPGARDAVGPGQRGGRVRAFDDVVLGFAAVRVAGHAALLAERAEILPSGEELVHVGLVPCVEDNAVAGGIEDPVHRDGELDDAEVRAQVPSRPGDVADQEIPDLGCQLIQLRPGQLTQVLRIPDGVQDSQRPLLRVVDMPFNSNASGRAAAPEASTGALHAPPAAPRSRSSTRGRNRERNGPGRSVTGRGRCMRYRSVPGSSASARRSGAGRTAGCRRCGSSPPRPGYRCAARRRRT